MRSHLLSFLLLPSLLAAQVPQAFDFQGIARDASGNVLPAQSISLRLTVVDGSPSGAALYQELHSTSTNAFGLLRVAVGTGTPVSGSFAAIDWSSGLRFLRLELDPAGGSSFLDMGTTQLLSVPYALHASSIPCFTVSLLGDTVFQGNGCYLIIPGASAANGGCRDLDGDGVYDHPGCSSPIDCDDTNASVYPGALEICGNGLDDDCDGLIDNHPIEVVTWYLDADGDGYGDPATTTTSCAQPVGHVLNAQDCNDLDPAVFAGQGCTFLCSAADAAWIDANQQFYMQAVQSAWISAVGGCGFGDMQCLANVIVQVLDDGSLPISGNCHTCAAEYMVCFMQNCLVACLGGTETPSCIACQLSSGCLYGFISCVGLIDADADGWAAGSDCDDSSPTANPNILEICDGIDNNCDGQIDEGVLPTWYPDLDEDGYGDDTGSLTACTGPSGYVSIGGDCDDMDPDLNPGMPEACDGMDNNCDGQVDEPGWDGSVWYFDGDLDGYGEPFNSIHACTQPPGYVSNDLDCDDEDPAVNPGSPEPCDGQDNDCDGQVDEGFNLDTDPLNCGFCGNACPQGSTCVNGTCVVLCPDNDMDGFTTCDGDCDDGTPTIFPGAPELCDGIDNDCDGIVDEGNPGGGGSCNTGFPGQCAAGTQVCQSGVLVCVPNNMPGIEICNGIDDDCDGQVDEGACGPEICDGIDNDGDGLIDAADPSLILVPCENQVGVCGGSMKPAGLCQGGIWLTCTPAEYGQYSGFYQQVETSCDFMDNNCNGLVDEGSDLSTDVNNCGSCGNVCTLPNAFSACNAGACAIAFCLPGFADCDGLAGNGCETFVGGGSCP